MARGLTRKEANSRERDQDEGNDDEDRTRGDDDEDRRRREGANRLRGG